MKKNYFLINFTDQFLIKIPEALTKNNNVILLGDNKYFQKDTSSYCNKFINYKSFFPRNFQTLENNSFLLTNDIIEKNKDLELLFFQLVDRIFIKSVCINSLKNYYYDLLKFWYNFFENNKNIDIIIFESHPHMPFDIFPYFVGKQFNIKSIFLKSTSINNFLLFDTELNKKDHYLELKINQKENLKYINEEIKIKTKKEIRASSLNEIKHVDIFNQPFRYIKSRLKYLFKLSYIKKRYEGSYYNLNFFEFIVEFIKRDIQKTIFRKFIKKKSIKPDLTTKYIYYSLHYQPERSTDPQANHYSNQLLPLKILNEIVPDDFYIYVKEHPRQYIDNYPDIRKKNYRNKEYYHDILRLSKVRMVDINFPSEILIKHAKLNASCTGSNVWEGLKILKPGIHFGHNWTGSCQSSPSVLNSTIEETKKQIKILLDKNETDVSNDIDIFLKKISNYGVISSNSVPFDDKISEELLVKNLINAIEGINDFK